MKGIYVTIETHFGELIPDKKYPVIRITKNWFVVMYKFNTAQKYGREQGYESGDSRTRSKISDSDVKMLNEFATNNGGIWKGG